MLDELKGWLAKKQFMPFRIALTDGSSYRVNSRFQIAIGKTQFMYCFPGSDRKVFIRADEMTSIRQA